MDHHYEAHRKLIMGGDRKWVEQQMSQMDNSNRLEATEEMKKVIHDHTVAGDLWTFDWANFKLQTCVHSVINNPILTGIIFRLEPKSTLKRKLCVSSRH